MFDNPNAKEGFILNGKPTKILGVCNHHDLGALGAALNIRAKERQLKILKEMGFTKVYDLQGGIQEWQENELETVN